MAQGVVSSHRIVVLQSAGPNDVAWRSAIHHRALQLGWSYQEYWGGDSVEYSGSGPSVLLTSEFTQAARFGATAVVILTDPPDQIAETYDQRLALNGQGRVPASQWLANAIDWVRAGTAVYAAWENRHEFPGLGSVEIDMAVVPPDREAPSPLAMYGDFASGRVREVIWPVSLLSTPEARPGTDTPMSLMGRRRHLLVGPYLFLPPGRFKLTLEFVADVERLAPSLRFEWGLTDDVAVHEEIINASGQYRLEMVHSWDKPSAVALKVMVERATFGGWLSCGSCRVTPI